MSTETALQKIEEPQAQELAVVRAPITPAQAKIDAVANLTMKAYERASTLQLTPEEVAALQTDFPDEAFQPGAAGKESLIYIEHAHLRDRLNQVFGPGQWAIVPRNRWAEDYEFKNSKGQMIQASRVYVEAMLCIRGCFVAEAVGDMVYYKNNDSQNYGDAVEGAKTAALRRCAKELGIGLQAWKKTWCEGWWARRRGGRRGPDPQPTQRQQPAKVGKDLETPVGKPKAATGKTRDWFLSEMRKLFSEATLLQWGCDDGPPYALMPNEPLEAWSLEQVPTSKEALREKIAQCSAFMSVEPQEQPKDEAPATSGQSDNQNASEADLDTSKPVYDEEGNELATRTGILAFVSEKSGKSKKGPWTNYGLKVGDEDQGFEWFNTFDKTMGELAKKLKGAEVRVSYRVGERGNELVGFEKVKE